MESILSYILYPPLIGFVVSLSCTALFSFLETSITALRLFKLKELADTSSGKYKHLLQTLEKNPHRILITVLIANSLANTTSAALITQMMERFFTSLNLSQGLGFSFGIGIATTCILVFGEIIPKNFAKSYGDRKFQSVLWIVNIVFYVLYPFVTLLINLSNFFIYVFSGKKISESTESVTSEKEIKFLIDYIEEKGLMESAKIEMLQSIFELSQTPVKEIMIPDTDVISINVNSSLNDALKLYLEYNYSRLPVYENKTDNIIGMIYQKDVFMLLSKNEVKPLSDLVRPVLFVPESVKVNQLLHEFKQKRMHIAMVVNEYGGIIGLVTLEDVLEEIVGEISDEYEESIPEKIIPLKQGGWLVDGGVPLEEISELLGITFDTENAITLGGFLTEQLQHLPRKGERIHYKNFCFQIQHASIKRVYEVLVFEDKKINYPLNLEH